MLGLKVIVMKVKCKGTYYTAKGCDNIALYDFDGEMYADSGCEDFTDRSEWVHLPCKVGDNVYCIFENKVCIANVLAFYIDKVGIICELKISLNGELPTAPCSVCHIDRDSYTDKDICLTREAAEKALEEKK